MKRRFLALLLSSLLTVSCASASPETAPELGGLSEPDRAEIDAMYPSLTNVPTVYIDIDRDITLINREEYVPAVITVSGSDTVEQTAELKGRGNASWGLPQKPFNIKFETAQDILGMGEARSWVLITLFYDKTLLRNYLTLNLDATVSGSHAMACRFADVVINGEYNGLYLLTEKVQDNENRVDISKKNGDVLFEIEESFRHDYECENCISLRSGTHLTFKDPEPDDLSANEMAEQKEKMQKLLSAADTAIRSGSFEDISGVINVESFVNWYIVNEFVKNYDSKFVTSCYCYVKDGVLFMGPSWDFDTCMGNQNVETCMDPTGFHVSKAPWYRYLLRNDEFAERLHSRWQELVSDGVFKRFAQSIDTQTEYLAESSALQFDRWTQSLKSKDLRGDYALFTYDEELDYLKSWTSQRVEWLNVVWQ